MKSITLVCDHASFMAVVLPNRRFPASPEIAIYDLGNKGRPGEPGQRVCSYLASSIADLAGPLALDLGVPRWTLDAEASLALSQWVRTEVLSSKLLWLVP